VSGSGADVGAVLRALAGLAPGPRAAELDVSRAATSPVVWVRDRDERLSVADATVARLAALDRLRAHERLLRYGWEFVYGEVTRDGAAKPVRLPLLSMPVRLAGRSKSLRIEPAGDVELTPLIADRAVAARLEALLAADDPEARDAWLREAAEQAGLPVRRVYGPGGHDLPAQWRRRLAGGGPYGVVTGALYVAREAATSDLAATLRGWAARPGVAATALAAMYGQAGGADHGRGVRPEAGADAEIRSPLPLNRAQREIVLRSRTEPLTVVSGPPGNGKSHTVVAAAIDAVDRGRSVLVATQSGYAADVLGDLLRRYPGPTPVLFGDAERRAAIIAELTAGLEAGYGEDVLATDDAAVRAAADRVRGLESAALSALERERGAERADGWEPLLPGLYVDAPRADEPDFDGARADRLLTRADPDNAATGPGGAGTAAGRQQRAAGRLERWRRRRAERGLRRLLGAAPEVPLDRLRAVLDATADVRARATLAATGGTDLGPTWTELYRADTDLAAAVGTAIGHRARGRQRWNADARRTVADLAAALRSGRNRRRETLAGMDGAALVRALPLWVGTVADVEDLLPPVPALFDLAILDEASHLDQLRAAPVLARARRALVVGDPRQLRFVSFVADAEVARIAAEHGLAQHQALDVRRNSAYDVAAGAAAATWLGDHHRSLPHLIGFSAARFYAERLAVVTRHPRNDSADLIEHRHVPGERAPDGSLPAEVTAALAEVRALAAAGESGIAVVSPFRGQVAALESALTAAFSLEEIDRLALRVGTVHGFQGSESEHVIVSVGVAPGDPPGRLRFVNDPNLFNVLVTRARRRMLVLTGLVDPPGLLGEYLRYGVTPPRPPAAAAPERDWPAALAAELRGLDLAVHPGYPVGSESVDLCLGSGDAAVGLICAVHPAGPQAHLERQRTLGMAGWRLRDAFATRWAGNPADAAITLAVDYRASVPVPGTPHRRA
jgi:hypothetical protein